VFIRLAEDMGIISDITRFILMKACVDCMTWPEHIAVSVNLSARDLRDADILSVVSEALNNSGLKPERLHLEITESCLIDEPAAVRAILAELRNSGITIAIDDFGTGFSSLSYLDTLPLDIIKIDRSFLRNIVEDGRGDRRTAGASQQVPGDRSRPGLRLLAAGSIAEHRASARGHRPPHASRPTPPQQRRLSPARAMLQFQ
jgi:EAL domain-containing protein (putative c-di-GMP-specific phosphodiesterase class I)